MLHNEENMAMTSKMKLRLGIIGCGLIAQKRALPAIIELDEIELTAIASRNPSKTAYLGEKYCCRIVPTYEELLACEDIEAVYIALPIGLHAEWVIKAAQQGKHVLCEKSLTPSLAQTEEVIRIAKECNVALFEGFAYQFHDQHTLVRQIIDSGEIGEPLTYFARFGFPPIDSPHRYKEELGGGALLDAGAYGIHWARTVIGREPLAAWGTYAKRNCEVDCIGSALLCFGEGVTSQITYGFDYMYQNNYEIWGTKGIIRADRVFSPPADFIPEISLQQQGRSKVIPVPACDNFKSQFSYFTQHYDDLSYIDAWLAEIHKQALAVDMVISGSISHEANII